MSIVHYPPYNFSLYPLFMTLWKMAIIAEDTDVLSCLTRFLRRLRSKFEILLKSLAQQGLHSVREMQSWDKQAIKRGAPRETLQLTV